MHTFIHSLIHSTHNMLSTDSTRFCYRGWRCSAQEMDALPAGTTSEECGDKLTNTFMIEGKVKEEKGLK